MAEIINLRLARKAKMRSQKERKAEQNRLKHGQSKAVRRQASTEAERARSHLEGHKLNDE